jgi:hypothetical protein
MQKHYYLTTLRHVNYSMYTLDAKTNYILLQEFNKIRKI